MAAPLLDDEFMKYWSKLTVVEKESLLHVAKQYVNLKEEGADPEALRKRIIMEERQNYLNGSGMSYEWEEVKQMALNTARRNGI
jgi:hypothetical protein